MIITISGTPGSGKSTVAKELGVMLKLKHYSTGQFMRQLAGQKRMSLLRFSKLAENDRTIDKKVDKWQAELGKNEDNFVIDARLGWHFIPKSIKIFIDADAAVRAKRIFSDKLRNEKNITLESAERNMHLREESEKKRYKTYYSIDISDASHYDLVVDSTRLSPDEVAKRIVEYVEGR